MHSPSKSPILAVDIIINNEHSKHSGIVFIERKYPPLGWALPGGHVDYGESTEAAAIREAKEETGLDVILDCLLGVYSKPDRDPRKHVVSVVYAAHSQGIPVAADDAKNILVCRGEIPRLVFDHDTIMSDYWNWHVFKQYPKVGL